MHKIDDNDDDDDDDEEDRGDFFTSHPGAAHSKSSFPGKEIPLQHLKPTA